MTERDELLHEIARKIDRLHELNEASSHHLQTIISTPERMLLVQLRHLAMLADDLVAALENPGWQK